MAGKKVRHGPITLLCIGFVIPTDVNRFQLNVLFLPRFDPACPNVFRVTESDHQLSAECLQLFVNGLQFAVEKGHATIGFVLQPFEDVLIKDKSHRNAVG